jgi:hypothetical protein
MVRARGQERGVLVDVVFDAPPGALDLLVQIVQVLLDRGSDRFGRDASQSQEPVLLHLVHLQQGIQAPAPAP